MKKFALITTGISPTAGGGVGAAYKLLSTIKSLGFDTTLLTVSQLYSGLEYKKSIENGRAQPIDKVLSIHEFFIDRADKLGASLSDGNRRGFVVTSDVLKLNNNIYIEKGNFKYYNISSANIKISFFNNNKLTKECFYNNKFVKKRETNFDDDKHATSEKLYTDNGNWYLTIGRKYVLHKGYVDTYYEVYNKQGEINKLSNIRKFQQYFVTESVTDNTIIWIDHPSLYTTFINAKIKNKKIFNFQNSHLYPNSNKIKPGYDNVIYNLGNGVDCLVVLTNSELEDLKKNVPKDKWKYIVVISHATPKKIINIPLNSRPKNKFLSLGRLEPVKRVDLMIKAFKKVVDFDHNAILDIYGHGSDYNSLVDLTKRLGLQDNVKFYGFTTSTDAVYQSHTALLFTSSYEGFGMTLMESLANGTPAIAFDIKYGPKDIITSQKDGFILEDGDVEGLSSNMIRLINLADNRFNQNALESSKRFSDIKYKNNVKNLLHDIGCHD